MTDQETDRRTSGVIGKLQRMRWRTCNSRIMTDQTDQPTYQQEDQLHREVTLYPLTSTRPNNDASPDMPDRTEVRIYKRKQESKKQRKFFFPGRFHVQERVFFPFFLTVIVFS